MKNKIHYLFLCLCLVCTTPFLTSCGDDKDETGTETGSDPASPEASFIGKWVANSMEEWGQTPGSTVREDYTKEENFTATLNVHDDGTGTKVEEDGDTTSFDWEYDDETGDLNLYIWNRDYDSEVKLTLKSASKLIWLERVREGSSYWYTQYIFTRTK